MFFGSKSIDDLTYDDIVLFISQRISESINLDYKMELTNTKELAKDVSSFANTEGGILIYGVETDESDKPKPIEDNAIVGIQTEPGLKEKIENQIISCILPRPDFFIKIISIPQEPQEKKSVIIIEVFKSFNCVHMVICRRDYRYYKRYNFSSIPLDEKEIQNKYKEIGITEKLIEKRIEKCITNINDLIPGIREKGLLALSFSPLNLHKSFFTDFSKINDVIRQQNHPEFISKGRTLIMKQNRFHKALDFDEDILYGDLAPKS